MQTIWEIQPGEPRRAAQLARACGVHPVTAQLLLRRGVQTREAARRFFSPSLSQLSDPFDLPDMAEGIARLQQALARREPILVFGDADVDGLTAAAILYERLRDAGAHVEVQLSNRIEDGYGLSDRLVEAICRTATKLVMLVDCGTNQRQAIELLAEAGIDTIVLDHHVLLEDPAAPTALINPHRRAGASTDGGRELCSAGLALKFCQAMVGPDTDRLAGALDLAALGTLADYAPLTGDNRVIVSLGLPRIADSRRPGLRRLYEEARLGEPAPESLLRGIVPRLNACGRLGDPMPAWRLLLTEDDPQRETWFAKAEEDHTALKALHRRVREEAQEQVNRLHFRDQYIVMVSHVGWPHGLMGPLASQLAARFGRPALALSADGDQATGSGRSVPLFNLLEALRGCQEFLVRFGGHAQACGLTVDRRHLDRLRAHINAQAATRLGREGLLRRVSVDLELSLGEVDVRWVRELQAFAPFGAGNRKPSILVRGASVESRSTRTGWVTDGLRRVLARGKLPSGDEASRYDLVGTTTLTGGELTITVSDARDSAAPS